MFACEVSFGLADFFINESQLFGMGAQKCGLTAPARCWLYRRQSLCWATIVPRRSPRTMGLGKVHEACRKVAAGATGCIVLRLQEQADGDKPLFRFPPDRRGARPGLRAPARASTAAGWHRQRRTARQAE
jgi:hypothetical protein